MREILLTQGKTAVVDDDDYIFLMQWKWSYNGRYAVRGEYLGIFSGKYKYKMIRMHRIISNTPAKMQTDHINGNGIDNRRSNLRICTHKENLCNQQLQQGKSSIYKGVYRRKDKNKWQAYIHINDKSKYLGLFMNEIDAAMAYNESAIKYFGEFARINEL